MNRMTLRVAGFVAMVLILGGCGSTPPDFDGRLAAVDRAIVMEDYAAARTQITLLLQDAEDADLDPEAEAAITSAGEELLRRIGTLEEPTDETTPEPSPSSTPEPEDVPDDDSDSEPDEDDDKDDKQQEKEDKKREKEEKKREKDREKDKKKDEKD